MADYWHISFRSPAEPQPFDDADDYAAIGTDPKRLPVFRLVGGAEEAEAFETTDLIWPGCMKWLLDAQLLRRLSVGPMARIHRIYPTAGELPALTAKTQEVLASGSF